MSFTNRISERVSNPTPEQIEEECRLIRTHWSPEIHRHRKINLRIDAANLRSSANLRFLRFLADYAETNS